MPQTLTTKTFMYGMTVAGARVCDAQGELCELDAAAGDGDLGATLAAGFSHLDDWLTSCGEQTDFGTLLVGFGAEMARTAPSTIGTLLATAFMRGGRSLTGVTELDGADLSTLLRAAADGVAERGGAEAGQRTILDAMLPSAEAADEARVQGADALEVLAAAAAGARVGAGSTVDMEPQLGRAGWIKDRARGLEDAGAAAWAIYLEGLVAGCRADSEKAPGSEK